MGLLQAWQEATGGALAKEAYKQYPDPEVAAHLIELLWTQGREVEAKDLIANQWRASPNNEHLRETAWSTRYSPT